jgi:glutathione S-transferase
MKLYLNKTSPYARLVMVVAHEKGLADSIELAWTDPWASPADLVAANPYSRVPALVTDGGATLLESGCIADYLDETGGGTPLMPARGAARLRALRKCGLGRGLIEAAFGVTIQRRFHADGGELAGRWLAAVSRATQELEREAGLLSANGSVDLGDLTVAIGLTYTEFRLPEVKWKAKSTGLGRWLDGVSARPSMRATAPE